METDFGQITVLDAAFTEKAQIFYTVSSSSRKTTVNGKTSETRTETVHPGYYSAMDGKMVFALKTIFSNTTDADIDLHKDITVKAHFVKDSPIYFSKGGNFEISDNAYKTLPAGESAEIILAAHLPVEQYLSAQECLLEVGGAQLRFSYDSIHVYNALGYQPGENVTVSPDVVIQAAKSNISPKPEETEAETAPAEMEAPIVTYPAVNPQDGSGTAEGRAVTIADVSVGFRDQLPTRILKDQSRYKEKLLLHDSQVYAVIHFTATNLTADTIDLADIHDDFLVQLTYNNKYRYATNAALYSVYESGDSIKLLRDNSSTGWDISVSPLASADVTLYIPCARQAAEDSAGELTVTFTAKYSGHENLIFTVDRSAPAA